MNYIFVHLLDNKVFWIVIDARYKYEDNCVSCWRKRNTDIKPNVSSNEGNCRTNFTYKYNTDIDWCDGTNHFQK